MRYNQYVIEAFEKTSGQWCARVSRSDNKTLQIRGHWSGRKLVTRSDAPTQAAALRAAMDLIDTGSLIAADKVPIEKFWRRRHDALR